MCIRNRSSIHKGLISHFTQNFMTDSVEWRLPLLSREYFLHIGKIADDDGITKLNVNRGAVRVFCKHFFFVSGLSTVCSFILYTWNLRLPFGWMKRPEHFSFFSPFAVVVAVFFFENWKICQRLSRLLLHFSADKFMIHFVQSVIQLYASDACTVVSRDNSVWSELWLLLESKINVQYFIKNKILTFWLKFKMKNYYRK